MATATPARSGSVASAASATPTAEKADQDQAPLPSLAPPLPGHQRGHPAADRAERPEQAHHGGVLVEVVEDQDREGRR